jgi:adenylate cyclase
MNKRIPIALGLLLLVLAIWIQLSSIPSIQHTIVRLQNLAYDLQLKTKLFTHKKFKDTPVVIVDIDDKSLHKEGRWPWPRTKLAALVTQLQKQGAVVIAFDMLFPEKEINIADTVSDTLQKQSLKTPEISHALDKIRSRFDSDAQFAESLKQLDIALGMTFIPQPITTGALPPPLIVLNSPLEKQLGFIVATGYEADIKSLQDAAKNVGFLNVFPDPDGIVRRVPLFMRYQDGLYPSLALQAVHLFLLSPLKLVTATYGDAIRLEGVQLGAHIIPTDPRSQVIIPFVGKSYTLPFISATDVLNDKISPDALAGKIIFVGTSAIGLGDLHATAIEGVFPGVEIQASVAYGLLQNNFSYKPAWSQGAEIFLTVFLGLIFILSFPFLGPRLLGLFIILIPILLITINNWIWEKTGLIISILIPLTIPIAVALLNIVYGYLFETRRREHLKEMFGQYVPAKHIDEMLTSGGNYGLLGEDREMTVLFADIRNFTAISEPLSASQLKDLLSEFFTPMTEIIFKHHGTIDKYVGDLIMAFWGAPLKDKRHAQHALTAALDMQLAVRKLQADFANRNLPDISIGIGLNTGVMSVGDMGSKFRRNYTVLGDAVNLASRIENLTKFYGVKIMVTEYTQKDQKLFAFRQLDRVRVKGKNISIDIFELVCRQTELTDALKQEIELSHQALAFYFHQQWENARDLFSELNKAHPDVVLYHLYLERITEYQQNPPSNDWDGVYAHRAK